MTTRTYQTTLILASGQTNATAIPVPFEPREVFGKARAPVVVSINGHSYRSTICNMGEGNFLPLAKVHRDAANVAAGDRITVTLTLDDQPRTVTPPKDLAAALKKAGVLDAFKAMSFTHQKEHALAIEDAKKPETRERRIQACIEMVRAGAARKKAASPKAPTKKTPARKVAARKPASTKATPRKKIAKKAGGRARG